MTPRTRAYIDIDGCINAYGQDTEGLTPLIIPGLNGASYRVMYNRPLVEELDALIDEFSVDAVFLTTWLKDGMIDRLVDGLDLFRSARKLPAPLPRMSGFSRRWKVHALIRDLRPDPGPFCWVDDELETSFRREARNTFDVPSLLIAPDATVGITEVHLKSMRRFFEEGSTGDLV